MSPTPSPLRVERRLVDSALLRGNPQGDPAQRELQVVLPPGYDDDARRYPVLWLLAGFTGFGATLLARGWREEAIDQRLARLFAHGCPPAIIALPDCCTRLGGSQYVDSSALGPYASHVVDELVPYVDAQFKTLREPGARAIAGKSSGGFGALHLALERPGTFGALACHSGDLGFELCYAHDFPACANALGRAGGVAPFLAAFFAKRKAGSDEFAALSTLAMAAAYSPRADHTDGFELPFDVATCELRPAVFARWLAFDPLRRIASGAATLRTLRALYVDCGSRDEYHLHFGARRFARECAAHGIALHHEEFDDGHRGTSWRYDHSLPLLLNALAPASA
ncbi:MAG: esterase [Planctomycetes bacterium]|nr:esterase [Planctomycetota bacterium]